VLPEAAKVTSPTPSAWSPAGGFTRSSTSAYTTGEKNRAQNCLTTSNIQLDHAFSDVFGKSATAILNYLLEHPDEENFDVTPFVDADAKRLLRKSNCPLMGLFPMSKQRN